MMRTTLKTLTLALLCGALLGGTAQAAPIGNSVQIDASVSSNGEALTESLGSGVIPMFDGSDEFGASFGDPFGTGNTIYADYTVNPNNSSPGPNGGQVYDVTIRFGSRVINSPPTPNAYYTLPIVPAGALLDPLGAAATINEFDFSFGATGGGVAFSETSDPSMITIIDRTTDPTLRMVGFPSFSSLRGPFGPGTDAYINADGTVGFDIKIDADALFAGSNNVSAFFGNNLVPGSTPAGSFAIGGFSYTFGVEVVPEPSTVALVSLASIGGVLFVRRRRA